MPHTRYITVTKEVPITSTQWKVISILSVLSAVPLFLLALIPILLFLSMLPNEASIAAMLFGLVPGLAGAAGFTGLIMAVRTPPDANDRDKVRLISVLLSIGFIVEGILAGLVVHKISWSGILLLLPMLMAFGYVCGDARESHKRLAEKTAIKPEELTGTTDNQKPVALGETDAVSKN